MGMMYRNGVWEWDIEMGDSNGGEEWDIEMLYWNGILEWDIGMLYRNGVLGQRAILMCMQGSSQDNFSGGYS